MKSLCVKHEYKNSTQIEAGSAVIINLYSAIYVHGAL